MEYHYNQRLYYEAYEHSRVVEQLNGRVLAQGLRGLLQFKPLLWHPVVEVTSSLHLAPAAYISIKLPTTVKQRE